MKMVVFALIVAVLGFVVGLACLIDLASTGNFMRLLQAVLNFTVMAVCLMIARMNWLIRT